MTNKPSRLFKTVALTVHCSTIFANGSMGSCLHDDIIQGGWKQNRNNKGKIVGRKHLYQSA